MRALADVVLVGAGTVRAEGYAAVMPKETFAERRVAAGRPPTATLAVVSRRLDLDVDAALFAGAGADRSHHVPGGRERTDDRARGSPT